MANLSNEDLKLVDSWAEASENSKGYQDRQLVLNLIQQFKNDLMVENFQIRGGDAPVTAVATWIFSKYEELKSNIRRRLWWCKWLHVWLAKAL